LSLKSDGLVGAVRQPDPLANVDVAAFIASALGPTTHSSPSIIDPYAWYDPTRPLTEQVLRRAQEILAGCDGTLADFDRRVEALKILGLQAHRLQSC
jgi:hypothetical protein